ncbi:PEP-CTERM sorting domain-containing protein [Haloferula rosea]|uniref:PEP-CTERM sorting domain-containing protein n=1 Tax=Haloferula rosea TaxID=490093 RepID=A0A934RGZ3_9BACT|nr:PEP-CTERM sorting domain-containing protein [Haloferula rosea]
MNGGPSVVHVQNVGAPPGDLVLNDGNGDLSFALIGQYPVDALGQIALTLTASPTGFANLDAVAFVVPEPSHILLLGVAALGGALRRRR